MLTALDIDHSELAVRLTHDAEMRVLNRTYRKKDAPTDVLAFSMREGQKAELAGDLLGDVVISMGAGSIAAVPQRVADMKAQTMNGGAQ